MTAPCPPWLEDMTDLERVRAIVKATTTTRRAPGTPFCTPHLAVDLLGDVLERAVAGRDEEIARLREALGLSCANREYEPMPADASWF